MISSRSRIQSDMKQPHLNIWNSKSNLLALALHGFLFLGLFQLGFTTEEWNRIKTIAKDYSVGPLAKTIMQELQHKNQKF